MSRKGRPVRETAAIPDRHRRTIEREIATGTVTHKNTELRTHKVCSSDRGQDIHNLNATAKGPELKLGKNYMLVEFIRERVLDYQERRR
jgi:transposase, IS30 family